MIKILYIQKSPDNLPAFDATHSIVDNDKDLIFTINIDVYGMQMQRSFNFDKLNERGNIYTLVLKDDENERFSATTVKMFEYIQRSIGQYVNIVNPDIVIGKIVFEDNSDILIYLSLPTYQVDEFECTAIDVWARSSTSYITDASPLYSAALRNYQLKKSLIEQVDIYSSVTYLESQLDAATRLLLLIASKVLENQEGRELIDILTAADVRSVLEIKSSEKIIKEFVEDKGKIRELQEAYYEAKANTD